MINIDINKGDYILVGRFKNKRIEVKEFGVDEHGLPTINGRGILKIRIEKLMKPKKQIKESEHTLYQVGSIFTYTNVGGEWKERNGIEYIITKITNNDVFIKTGKNTPPAFRHDDKISKKEFDAAIQRHVYKLKESKQFSLAEVAKKILKT